MKRSLMLSAAVFCLSGSMVFGQSTGDRAYRSGETGQTTQGEVIAGEAGAEQNRQTGQTGQNQQTQQNQQGRMSQGKTYTAEEQKKMSEMAFKYLSSGNQYEIQVSQLALANSDDPRVKQYAQMIVNEHGQAQSKIEEAAKRSDVNVSRDLMPIHQTCLDHLKMKAAMKDNQAFQMAYMNDQVANHAKDVLMLAHKSQSAQDPNLKQLASQLLPAYDQHLQQSRQIAVSLIGDTGNLPQSLRQYGANMGGHDMSGHGQGMHGGMNNNNDMSGNRTWTNNADVSNPAMRSGSITTFPDGSTQRDPDPAITGGTGVNTGAGTGVGVGGAGRTGNTNTGTNAR